MTPEQEIAVADEAKALLEHPIIKDFLETERVKWMQAWITSPARDAEGREHIWRHYKAAEAFEARLRALVDTGKMAQMQLEKANAQSEGSYFDE